MLVIPAIDLKKGRCVRLLQGRAEDETVYGEDPVAMARQWAGCGAKLLHLVDLDGAFEGKLVQRELIAQMAQAVDCPVQVGGGVRTVEEVTWYLENGLERVVVGTAALENPAMVRDALALHGPDHLALALDVRDGRVAVKGWEEVTERPYLEVAEELVGLGVEWIIFTAIARDGMMRGPDFGSLATLMHTVEGKVIASGGVSSEADLGKLDRLGAAGAIVGKALYEGSIATELIPWR